MQVCRIGDPVAISNSAYATSKHQLSCVESPFGFAMVAYKQTDAIYECCTSISEESLLMST